MLAKPKFWNNTNLAKMQLVAKHNFGQNANVEKHKCPPMSQNVPKCPEMSSNVPYLFGKSQMLTKQECPQKANDLKHKFH